MLIDLVHLGKNPLVFSEKSVIFAGQSTAMAEAKAIRWQMQLTGSFFSK